MFWNLWCGSLPYIDAIYMTSSTCLCVSSLDCSLWGFKVTFSYSPIITTKSPSCPTSVVCCGVSPQINWTLSLPSVKLAFQFCAAILLPLCLYYFTFPHSLIRLPLLIDRREALSLTQPVKSHTNHTVRAPQLPASTGVTPLGCLLERLAWLMCTWHYMLYEPRPVYRCSMRTTRSSQKRSKTHKGYYPCQV